MQAAVDLVGTAQAGLAAAPPQGRARLEAPLLRGKCPVAAPARVGQAGLGRHRSAGRALGLRLGPPGVLLAELLAVEAQQLASALKQWVDAVTAWLEAHGSSTSACGVKRLL